MPEQLLPTPEQDEALLRAASFRSQMPDWHAVTAAMFRHNSIVDGPIEGMEEREEFMQDVVERGINHPHELVVFYRADLGNFNFFSTAIIDPDRPFEISMYELETTVEALPATHTYAHGLHINYPSKEISVGRMPGARELGFNALSSTNPTVWMGAGVRAEDIDPDSFMRPNDIYPRREIAIGTSEVADLFTSLRDELPTNKQRLFGALFQVAKLGFDFDVDIPVVPAFAEEAARVREYIGEKQTLSGLVSSQDRRFSQRLSILVDDFEKVRLQIIEQAEDTIPSNTVSLPYMGDSRSWPYLDVAEYVSQTGMLNAVKGELDREASEHRRRAESYMEWLTIVNRIVPVRA